MHSSVLMVVNICSFSIKNQIQSNHRMEVKFIDLLWQKKEHPLNKWHLDSVPRRGLSPYSTTSNVPTYPRPAKRKLIIADVNDADLRGICLCFLRKSKSIDITGRNIATVIDVRCFSFLRWNNPLFSLNQGSFLPHIRMQKWTIVDRSQSIDQRYFHSISRKIGWDLAIIARERFQSDGQSEFSQSFGKFCFDFAKCSRKHRWSDCSSSVWETSHRSIAKCIGLFNDGIESGDAPSDGRHDENLDSTDGTSASWGWSKIERNASDRFRSWPKVNRFVVNRIMWVLEVNSIIGRDAWPNLTFYSIKSKHPKWKHCSPFFKRANRNWFK